MLQGKDKKKSLIFRRIIEPYLWDKIVWRCWMWNAMFVSLKPQIWSDKRNKATNNNNTDMDIMTRRISLRASKLQKSGNFITFASPNLDYSRVCCRLQLKQIKWCNTARHRPCFALKRVIKKANLVFEYPDHPLYNDDDVFRLIRGSEESET